MEDVEMTDLTSGRGFHGSEVPRGNGGQSRMPTNVVPLVVAQIINSKAAEFRMFRMPVNIAKLVGIVRKFTVETVKASCFIQDHTGTIKAITWLENESDMSNIPLNLEGKYVECFGRIRQELTGKVIMALKMVEIKDCNIINTHLLEVLYIRLEAEAAMKKQRSLATSKGDALAKVLVESEHDQPSSPSAHPNSSSMVTTMVEKLPSLQRKIYTLLTCDSTVTGLSAKAIMAGFQEHSRDQILSALKGLCEEGFIYSTIDEQHFKAIEF